MNSKKNSRIKLGGSSLFNWKTFGYVSPIIILRIPFVKNIDGTFWTFWRWTLVAILSWVALTIFYFFGGEIYFTDREKFPVPDYLTFIYGFILGFIFGGTLGSLSYLFKLEINNLQTQTIESALSYGIVGLVLFPLGSLVTNAIETYRTDRESLIAARMLVASQKNESKEVIKGLRSSMSKKVDDNLLNIIKNSKEFFDSKNRSLEENWELMAEQLREAALDTVRPFSHSMHKRGTEKKYRVKLSEIFGYVAYSFDVHVFWSSLIFTVISYRGYFNFENPKKGLQEIAVRFGVLIFLLFILKLLRISKAIRNLYGFFISLILLCYINGKATNFYLDFFNIKNDVLSASLFNSAILFIIVVLVSLSFAFIHGENAEMEYLEKRISEEHLETRLILREEARISREIAKYLHGTIQSRLMASAVGVESAGRRGDKKALKREVASAYQNLKLPDETYFANPESTLEEEINKVITKWQDLMTIKVAIDKKLPDMPDDLIQDIGNVVNEALANSFRHGQAQSVAIKIGIKPEFLEIGIADNGSAPLKGRGGLGSEWFDALAGKNWKLTENAKGGTTLTLLVPRSKSK